MRLLLQLLLVGIGHHNTVVTSRSSSLAVRILNRLLLLNLLLIMLLQLPTVYTIAGCHGSNQLLLSLMPSTAPGCGGRGDCSAAGHCCSSNSLV